MFDRFTPDIIDTLDKFQKLTTQPSETAVASLRAAMAALKETAADFEQRAVRAADAADREQFRTLAHGFAAAANICDRSIAS